MTRTLLTNFIATHGITDASIRLGRHPIALTRFRDGVDEIPEEIADYLKQLQEMLK